MNPTSLLPQSGMNFKLYYVVPISFIYLFSQIGGQTYLLFAIFGLIGATSRHALDESLYGPGGEEKAKLSEEEEIRRLGTVIYRDKKPFAYSATSFQEMLKEGNLHSRSWGGIMVVLSLFQAVLSVLYLFAIYDLYLHRSEIGFIGAVLLFSLIALVINGVVRILWPNASQMDREIPEIDPELQDIVEGCMYTLNGDGVSILSANYEPAEGGVFEIDCEVDYEYGETVKEDINRVAVTFCSIADRSPYPIDGADISLSTTNGVVIDFRIDPLWCRQVLDGRMSSDQYIWRVNQTISTESSNSDVSALQARPRRRRRL